METRRNWFAKMLSAGAALRTADAAEDAGTRLAEESRRRHARKWLPFDWKTAQPPLKELLGAHPRLLGAPSDRALWRLRAAAIPKDLWQPRAPEPTKLQRPNPKGNGGRAENFLELAAAWLATGDDFYLKDATRAMLRVCEYPHWGAEGKAKDTDLDAGGLLMGLGVAYDTFFDRISPADRKTIRDKLVLQSRLMYAHHHRRPEVQWEQNHTYIALGGLWCAAAALYDETPEARQWYDLGVKVLKTAVHLLDGGDGAFYEGLGYWNYGFALHLLPQLEMFRNVTGADPFGAFGSLRQMKYYLMHGLLPGGQYWLNVGDTGHTAVAPSSLNRARYVMLKFAGEFQDPECQFLAEYFARVRKLEPAADPWTLASWDPTVPSRDPRKSWAPSHHFQDLDLVTARTDWSDQAGYLAMRCGPALGHRATGILLRGEVEGWKPSTGHVHPDLNSLVIFDHGEHMVVDTGYTWTKLTRDHSTVAVDGGGQVGDGERWPGFQPWLRHGRIGAFLALAGEYFYLRGEAANGYKEALKLGRFDRHIMMLPDADSTCFLVHDILESSESHRYDWLLLTMEKAVKTGENEYRMRSGRRVLTIRLLAPAGVAGSVEPVVVTERPMPGSKPERGHRLTLSAASPARNAEFLVLLALHDADAAAPAAELVKGAWKIRNGRCNDTLVTGGSGDVILTDGHHAAARHEQERLARWAVNDAKRLAVSGREICASAAPFSAAGLLQAARNAVTIEMKSAAEIALHAPSRPSECKLDGKSAGFRYDASTGMLRLLVRAGRHELEYN